MSEQPATGPMPVSPQGPPLPEEAVDQTVRLKAGEPTPPASSPTIMMDIQSVPPTPQPTSAATQDMPALFPDPTQTVTLGQLPTLPSMPEAERFPAPAPVKPKGGRLWVGILAGLVILLLILGGVGIFGYRAGWFGERQAPPSFASTEDAPKAVISPAIRPYLERAEAGDATAMQMLGYFYYYGLNVPQNHQEGLRWYHKAADAGSVSARKELAALEGKAQ